jgi:energy-converting hydrogenase Eha subunit A
MARVLLPAEAPTTLFRPLRGLQRMAALTPLRSKPVAILRRAMTTVSSMVITLPLTMSKPTLMSLSKTPHLSIGMQGIHRQMIGSRRILLAILRATTARINIPLHDIKIIETRGAIRGPAVPATH